MPRSTPPVKEPPSGLRPMLATLTDAPFDDPAWLFEVKWDGYRCIADLRKSRVDLISRNGKSFNEKFYPVYDALRALGLRAVLDGEIVVAKPNGVSDFGALQNWRSEADGELYYYVFDLLSKDGKNLKEKPLSERRELLKKLIPESGVIRTSEAFDAPGTQFFQMAGQMGLEGIIAKRKDSIYIPGERTRDWLKIKTHQRQEVVIGGFTKNKGTIKQFSALLAGVMEKGKLVYTGKIGTGFSDKMQQDMMKQFRPLITKRAPFEQEPDVNKPSRFRPDPPQATVTWLKPKLVCEVSFSEMTADGVMRHPSFEGMRTDKAVRDVIREKATATEKLVGKKAPAKTSKKASSTMSKTMSKVIPKAGKAERRTLLNPTEETQVKKIKGHEIKFSNLNKVYWPKDKVTKRDMLNYYYQGAPFILPYLKDRPQSMNRYPNGINGQSFYQKDITGKAPEWLDRFKYHTADEPGKEKNFLVACDEASLLYMASLGAIEMNPWSSRVQKPDNPDWCVIDLDPDKNHFDKVIEVALVTRDLLASAGVETWCKTSGSTGIHIYMPLGAKYTYEQSKEFGRVIAKLVHAELPKFTSIERATAKRVGKLYIDFLQNRPQATLAAPYSLRPKPGATVSTPLHWDEVKKGMKMQSFNIHNTIDRLKEVGDLFRPVLGKGINMQQALKKLPSP